MSCVHFSTKRSERKCITEISALKDAIDHVAELKGVKESGFRLINNCGADAGQTVMHLHIHLIGGVSLGEKLI